MEGPSVQAMWNADYTPDMVTGRDCEWAAFLFKMYGRRSTFLFWDTVRDLMLAGFCCLLMIGCGATETVSPEIAEQAAGLTAFAKVEAKQDATITVLKENTAALARIETKLEASLSAPKPNGEEVIKSAPNPPAKANTAPAPIKVATPGDFSRIASDGTRLKWNVEGNWNPTILETSAHLRTDHGVDTNGMTHQEMADIHASIHDGKQIPVSAVRVKNASPVSNCPGGTCPTNRTQRRRGLFGGLFR